MEPLWGQDIWPIQFKPRHDLLGLRQVLLRFLEVLRVNVDESHGQFVRAEALLHPLDQRESLDAEVSGDAPDVKEERLAAQALAAHLLAVGRLEGERRAAAADN